MKWKRHNPDGSAWLLGTIGDGPYAMVRSYKPPATGWFLDANAFGITHRDLESKYAMGAKNEARVILMARICAMRTLVES